MGSVVSEKRPLKIGDSSLLVCPPRYKRRKVSAIRDFPDGCGPNAVGIIPQNREEINEKKDGGILRNVESSVENDRNCCEVVKEANLEQKEESQKHVADNKVVEERVDLKERAHAIDSKLVDEGTSLQPCSLPHYPIPPNFVWKEPKYPPRRKVSAIRDFPIGCGSNVRKLGEIEEKHVGQGEPGSENKGVTNPNSAITIKVNEADDVLKDKVEVEHSSQDDKDPLSKSYELKGQEEISKEKSGGQNENGIELLECNGNDERDTSNFSELNKELVVYSKDKRKRKKSIGVPCRNIRLQEESIVGVGSGNNRVIVLGLVSALHSPFSSGKGLVKTTPTSARAKKSKCNFSSQDTRKRSPNKSKDDTKDLEENSMMMIPYHEDIDEESRPLDMIDNDDSSENDDIDDFQLLPRGRAFDISLPPFGASSSQRCIRSKVRETLRLFQAVHRKLLQEEETKSKDQENESKRTDLRAAKILKDRGKYINTEKVIGPVPGVEVGDIFNYRTELAIIGLHSPLQGGIDTIKLDKKAVAISIVASGGYANDMDSSDVLIYTGQGGNATGKDKQPGDQKLEKGNLALKHCIDKKTLVRVIRGFRETKPSETPGGRGKTIATYTYDGLYTVDKYWHDLGAHGKLVYKFELNRVPGQPELAWKEVKQSRKSTTREGCCVADISGGKENFSICAVNTIDDENFPPFTYITRMMYPDWCQPIPSKGCDCKNGCSDSEHCACALKNGGEIPFNYSGAIVQAKSLVYECGPLCKCPPSCHNRVSQHGIKLPLEVFKTNSMGWGVRCLCAIPSGSFICEYIGELLDDKEAEQRTGNDEYLFDIGQNYNDTTLWDGLSALLPDLASNTDEVIDVGFTIDAVKCGNIGRFINHSCSPNLYAQNVLYDHEDKRIPHIMFFAAENIPPLQELTYHYNYTIDQVFDSEGNIKKKSCYCGSAECTGRMY